MPSSPHQHYHYYFFSIAQSPSSPVNLWQEGKLGSSGEEQGAEQGGGGEQGQDVQEGGEWLEEENATGTLDSIRTEGSLEEPRYAKVASSISQMFQTFLGQLKSNPPCQHVSALNSSECPNKR